MDKLESFKEEVKENIKSLSKDSFLQNLSRLWMRDSATHKWSYNFSWMGRPAIQFPNDTWAMQELIWQIKPDLIIETGIAHGGSLVFYASMLSLLDTCESLEEKKVLNPYKTKRKVLGIDIDIRDHNRTEIENHPMFNWIEMIEGSSISEDTINKVHKISSDYKKILVTLDSNHTHQHVLKELKAYAPLVTQGSYCVVFVTVVEDMPSELCKDRPWGPGNNPKTAVIEWLKDNPHFKIDKDIDNKLLISVGPDGYLKREN